VEQSTCNVKIDAKKSTFLLYLPIHPSLLTGTISVPVSVQLPRLTTVQEKSDAVGLYFSTGDIIVNVHSNGIIECYREGRAYCTNSRGIIGGPIIKTLYLCKTEFISGSTGNSLQMHVFSHPNNGETQGEIENLTIPIPISINTAILSPRPVKIVNVCAMAAPLTFPADALYKSFGMANILAEKLSEKNKKQEEADKRRVSMIKTCIAKSQNKKQIPQRAMPTLEHVYGADRCPYQTAPTPTINPPPTPATPQTESTPETSTSHQQQSQSQSQQQQQQQQQLNNDQTTTLSFEDLDIENLFASKQ
jgi:hypothetical protein